MTMQVNSIAFPNKSKFNNNLTKVNKSRNARINVVDPCVAALRRATYQLLATTRAVPHWLLFDSKSVVHWSRLSYTKPWNDRLTPRSRPYIETVCQQLRIGLGLEHFNAVLSSSFRRSLRQVNNVPRLAFKSRADSTDYISYHLLYFIITTMIGVEQNSTHSHLGK